MSTQIKLPIIHFNDVYKMTLPHKSEKGDDNLPIVINRHGLTSSNFNHVIAFAKKIQDIRDSWETNSDEEPQGLLLFSGDLFSASVESALTRGRNMVHLMNELAPDACVPGNHEFDFGRLRFNELIEFCNFDWVLSNIEEHPLDANNHPILEKSKPLKGLRKFIVLKRAGLKIGIIGLMSKDALDKTNTEVKSNLVKDTGNMYDMIEPCKKLAEHLRKSEDESGEGCDLVFAITHAEHTEDIELAKCVGAFSAHDKVLKERGELLENIPGVDAIFGGHNHDYYLGPGVELDGEPTPEPNEKIIYRPRYSNDEGLLIVKSGSDFKDLSEIEIQVEERPDGKVRKKIITSLKVTRHNMEKLYMKKQNMGSPMARVLKRQYNNEVLTGLDIPVATMNDLVLVDGDASRVTETIAGNWIADSLLKWHDHLLEDGQKRSQAFIMTGGTIRGGFTLGGDKKVTAGDVIELLPFETTLASIDVTGEDLKTALNAALAKSYRKPDGLLNPSGSFPVVSGMCIKWDSTKPEESRLQEVWFVDVKTKTKMPLVPSQIYRILTNSYIADGNSSFQVFKNATNRSTYEKIPMYQVLRYRINDLAALHAHNRAWDIVSKLVKIPKDIIERATEEASGEKSPFVGLVFDLFEFFGGRVKKNQEEEILTAKHRSDIKLPTIPDLDNLPELDINTSLGSLGERMIDLGNPV